VVKQCGSSSEVWESGWRRERRGDDAHASVYYIQNNAHASFSKNNQEEGKVIMLMPVFITYRIMRMPVFQRITKNSAPGLSKASAHSPREE
jgi:hypothetical protein